MARLISSALSSLDGHVVDATGSFDEHRFASGVIHLQYSIANGP
jgi:hypothetical protein